MKKFAAIFTTLLAGLTLTAGTIAYAEESPSSGSGYPQLASTLAFTNLTAYAADDSEARFAFADGNNIYVFDGSMVSDSKYSGTLENDGTVSYYYGYTSTVTGLGFDGENVVFTDGKATYAIINGEIESTDYEISSLTDYKPDDNLIINLYDGSLYIYQSGNGKTFDDGTYSSLKKCGNSLYVIRDNELCVLGGTTIDDFTVTALTFEYLDIGQGETIEVSSDVTELLTTAGSEVKTVTLPAGTYVTQIDISDLSGTYYKTCGDGTYALQKRTSMLYLCTADGIDILANGGNVYLTASGNTLTTLEKQSYSSLNAYINTSCSVYSMPYMAKTTAIDSIDFQTAVTVNAIYTSDVLQCNFAYITYTDKNGASASGYVAESFLTEYSFPAEDGSYNDAEYVDHYEDDNVIITVVLVIIIVILFITGVAYIGFTSGMNRRKNKKNDDDSEASDE